MENINRLVELAQELDAAIDDVEEVISMNINSSGSVSYLVDVEYLLRKFDNVDVLKKNDREYPFKLETEIEGVSFCSHVHLDKSELLRGYVPDEWIVEVTKPMNEICKIRSSRQNYNSNIKKAD